MIFMVFLGPDIVVFMWTFCRFFFQRVVFQLSMDDRGLSLRHTVADSPDPSSAKLAPLQPVDNRTRLEPRITGQILE